MNPSSSSSSVRSTFRDNFYSSSDPRMKTAYENTPAEGGSDEKFQTCKRAFNQGGPATAAQQSRGRERLIRWDVHKMVPECKGGKRHKRQRR